MKTCICHHHQPFKVGDKVICNYGRINRGIVQTVLKVTSLPIGPDSLKTDTSSIVGSEMSGYAYMSCSGNLVTAKIKVDGGPICKDCGLRPAKPVTHVDTWFRLATQDEINGSIKLYGNKW